MRKLLLAGVAVFGGFTLIVMILGAVMTVQVDRQQPRNSETIQQEEVTPDGLYLAINRVRHDNGLSQFKRNMLLDKSAKLKCRDMVAGKYYDHVNPKTGKVGGSYIADVGQYHNGASENLNQGNFMNSADVVASWMGSEAHAASILNPKFTEIGFSICKVNGLTTIVQHKIEPEVKQVQQRSTTRTRCTYYDYGAYGGGGSPTVTCKTY